MCRSFVRVEAGSLAERFTGGSPVIVAQREWYGQPVYVCERVSDGCLFTVFPRGCVPDFLDGLEARAVESLEQKGW